MLLSFYSFVQMSMPCSSAFGIRKRWILTENPGISKSWFQWKFILFCCRLDLFDKFSPFEEKLLEELKTEDQMSTEQDESYQLNHLFQN